MEKTMLTKILPFEVKEVAPRTLEFVGSTETRDREGDVIMANGWKLANFKKNPVFLWAHDYQSPPVGKAVKVWASDGQLRFHIQFAERDTYEFADVIYKLYKGGFIRATSVGFMPIKSEPLETKDDDEGLYHHQPTRYLQQDLLELSGCPVPANPEALAEAKAKGLLTQFWKFYPDELKDDEVLRPYPNEHACRLRNPDDFQDGSFKRTTRKHDGKEYSVIMGKLTGETTMTDQAYRYDKEVWTAATAKSHCEAHDGTFEAATGAATVYPYEITSSAGGTGPLEASEGPIEISVEREITDAPDDDDKQAHKCECIECGYQMATDKHCADLKCPKCGADMRRQERPGPGTREGEPKEVSQEEIADNLDYIQTQLGAVGLNAENIERTWEIVRLILRDAGGDIPVDIAEKIGAVLNKVNRERLHKIRSLAQEVLDSAEKPDEPDKELSEERITERIAESVRKVIDEARGKRPRPPIRAV